MKKTWCIPSGWFTPGSRHRTLDELKNLKIFLPNGALKPITYLATFDSIVAAAEIKRENLQTIGIVSARLENRDLGAPSKILRAS